MSGILSNNSSSVNILQPETKTKKEFPKSIKYLIGNEFCERFSFFGIKAILWTYLITFLNFSSQGSIITFHSFIMLAYTFTFLGAVLADSYLGKFRTILYFSMIYCMGNLFLALSSVFTAKEAQLFSLFTGLLLLALGTGGVKPCVASFGGDQFSAGQTKETSLFFTLFYFSINAGGLFSIVITPWIRENVKCFGQTCFVFAFGLPAILMILSTVILYMGRSLYIHRPLGPNGIATFYNVIRSALKNRKSKRSKEHWIYSADFSRSVLDDVYRMYKLFLMFLPISLLWMIYDQQGSRWTAQAWMMDNRIGSLTIPPESMQVWNNILILIMVPVFESLIYPFLESRGIVLNAIKRITIGLVLCVISSLCSALVQFFVAKSNLGPGELDPNIIICSSECISILYQIPQYMFLTCGELMVSISGFQFAYSEAPPSMKSFCQSAWLFTVSIGNVFVIILNLINPSALLGIDFKYSHMTDSIMYSALLLLATIVFVFLSSYKSRREYLHIDSPSSSTASL